MLTSLEHAPTYTMKSDMLMLLVEELYCLESLVNLFTLTWLVITALNIRISLIWKESLTRDFQI